jgi:hypothetical protein
MKTITSTSLLAALLVLSSCWPTVEKHISPQPPSAKVIFIAEDLSLSARHLNWTQEALVEIILADSLEAEITLAGMFIGNESYKQTPFLAGMIRPNIQPLSGQEKRLPGKQGYASKMPSTGNASRRKPALPSASYSIT